MKRTILLLCVASLLACCGSKNATTEISKTEEPELLEYENGYLSFSYPSDWEIYSEKASVPDSIPDMVEGFSISVFPKNNGHDFAAIYVVKSALMPLFNTPEEWRDLSIATKVTEEGGAGEYSVGYVADSLDFNGENAAFVKYNVQPEGTSERFDQDQIVVLRANGDLYYINHQYTGKEDEVDSISRMIINSITFK